MGLLDLPEHQPQIHFGRQLPVPGTAGTAGYLAAHDREAWLV